MLVGNEMTGPVAAGARVEFYWRPGCPFCSRLRRKLEKSGIPLEDHNIWEEPRAAARVREIAGGNETVPTVVVRGIGLVNPSVREVERLYRS